jgi:hypothetical protein
VEVGTTTGAADLFALFDIDEQGALLFADVDLPSDSPAFLESLVASTQRQRRGGVVVELAAARRRTAAA